MSSEKTYNLSAAIDSLHHDETYALLVRETKQAVRYGSLRADLQMALESCRFILTYLDVSTEDQVKSNTITLYALLTTAISHYARATSTKSKGRDPADLYHKFSESERAVHKELCDLRDRAIAHHEIPRLYDKDWTNELAVMSYLDGNVSVKLATRRLAIDRDLVDRTRSQIKMALDIVDAELQRRANAVTTELISLGKKDGMVWQEIARHPLNLDLFFS